MRIYDRVAADCPSSERHLRLDLQGDRIMSAQNTGQEHGAAIRRAAGFAADLGIALATDVAWNARRVLDYAVGFGRGLLRRQDSLPNA